MLSFTAASYTVAEGDGSTMDICAEISNVLSPSGTMETITINVIVTAGTASMSSQIPPVTIQRSQPLALINTLLRDVRQC